MSRLFQTHSVSLSETFGAHGEHYHGLVVDKTLDWRTGYEYLGPRTKPDVIREFAWQRTISTSSRVNLSRADTGWSTDCVGPQAPVLPQDQYSYDLVYNKALDKLNESLRGSLDVSIDAFQWRQTANMSKYLTQTLHQAGAFMRSVARRPSKEVASKFLEWTYGLSPTLSTIYDLYEKIYKQPGRPIRLRGRSSRVDQVTPESQLVYPYGLSGPWALMTFIGSRSTRAEIVVDLKPVDLSKIQELAGFTSLNPVSIGWELVPYSFVADWFYNLGGYIRAFETYLVYRSLFLQGWVTWTVKSTAATDNLAMIVPGVATSYSPASTQFWYKWRKPLSDFPSPHRPRLHCDLGSRRMLNAAALLRNILK